MVATAHDPSCAKITWRDSAGATEYRVYRKAAGGGYILVGKTHAGTQVFFDASCPAPGATWDYAVAAYDGHSESKKSPAASVVLPNAPAATTLTNLFAGAPGSADPAEARYTPDAVLLNDGKTILLAYTKGMERHNLAHLAGRTSADHGATWSAEFTLLPTGSYAGVGKPEFFKINSEIIGLVYSIWTQDGTSRRGFRSTTDNGKTWSPEVIVADGFGGRNASGCIAGKGRLISLLGKAGDPGRHLLYVTWSDNQGATWSQPALVSAKPRGESAAAYLGNDTVLVITRSAKTDTEPCYLLFKSTDNGETFFELPDSSAIWCGSDNPPELTVIPGTSTVLAVVDSYMTSAAAVQKDRRASGVFVSTDAGASWSRFNQIDYGRL